MIRRPLWNRGGGVFVEEAAWSVPLDRRPAADLPVSGEPTPAVHTAPAADRPRGEGVAKPPPAVERCRSPRHPQPPPHRERLGARPAWLGVLTVREDD